MKVSVVIPAYNEEKFIGKCLQSIKDQIEAPDEVIVIDNNSKDDTAKIAAQYGAKVVKETDQGMISARNRGFNEASGDIFARCDSDTILPKDWIKNIKVHFQKESVDGITGPTMFYDLKVSNQSTLFTRLYSTYMRWRLHGNDVLLGSNMIITRKAWELVKNEVCLRDKDVHEDIDISIHMTKHGLKIVNEKDLVIGMSSRRLVHNPTSFFIEYVIRNFKTFARKHKYIEPTPTSAV